jgi:hypothetical protein
MVADFKMEMTTSKPSFQRVAISKSLQKLASKAYMGSTRNRDMAPFIRQVQKRWRTFAATLRACNHEPFHTKKFGYARNCVPTLVTATSDKGVLIPCNSPVCPFCWGRNVVIRACQLLEPHKNDIERWRWGVVPFTYQQHLHPNTMADVLRSARKHLPKYAGLITHTHVWGDHHDKGISLSGQIKYLGIVSEEGFELGQQKRMRYDGSPDNVYESKNPHTRSKHAPGVVGQAFAYPEHLMPPKASKSQVEASVYWWERLREVNFRAFRTSGIFYNSGKASAHATNRSKEDQFNDIYKRLSALEELAGLNPAGGDDNE